MNSQAYDVDKFQPTSPVRETTAVYLLFCKHFIISTHVPRAGDDVDGHNYPNLPLIFQPTSPVRETTYPSCYSRPYPQISTHVPRAGDDMSTKEESNDSD